MNNQEIQALLFRYRLGQCTVEETARIEEWYERLNRDASLLLNDDEKEFIENRLLKRIKENIQETELLEVESLSVKWWKSNAWYSGVAAAVVILLAYAMLFSKSENITILKKEPLFVQNISGQLIVHENQTPKAEKISLEDGSIVTLSPGSRIIYSNHFTGDKRDVQLVGDAFFEITKNPEKPFLVYSGKLITRVLGTSFRIKTNTKDMALEVEVVTGKVSVFENNDAFTNIDSIDVAVKNNNGVVLTPNQRVTYFPESRHLMTGLVMEPVKMEVQAKIQPKLEFNNAQLLEIVGHLEREYGIEIVFANDRLEKCTFTGDISEMPLYEKLHLLCKSNGASYEVKGTRILINGEGCE